MPGWFVEVFQIGDGAKYVLLVYSDGGGLFLTITTYACLLATNHFLAQFEDLFQNMCTKAYFMCVGISKRMVKLPLL